MSEFSSLRNRAKTKRDKAIAKARAEYASTLVAIAALEQDLAPGPRPRFKTIGDCIDSLLPLDRPFTVGEIVAGVEAASGQRVWRRKTVVNYVSKLLARGVVRRLSRPRGDDGSVYAMTGAGADVPAFAGMSLPAVVKAVLTRPMNVTELTVAILEAGFKTSQTNSAFRHSVAAELREGPYRKVGGKWAVA